MAIKTKPAKLSAQRHSGREVAMAPRSKKLPLIGRSSRPKPAASAPVPPLPPPVRPRDPDADREPEPEELAALASTLEAPSNGNGAHGAPGQW